MLTLMLLMSLRGNAFFEFRTKRSDGKGTCYLTADALRLGYDLSGRSTALEVKWLSRGLNPENEL